MLGEFKYEFVERDSSRAVVNFLGTIDERTDLASVFEGLPHEVVIDLGGIEHINSVGVREWMRFISKACSEHSISLQNCSPVMVRQFNMIFNARGTAKITSVILPYYCSNCGNEPRVVLQLGTNNAIPETVTCGSCQGEAEFDDLPDNYLSFLNQDVESPGR